MFNLDVDPGQDIAELSHAQGRMNINQGASQFIDAKKKKKDVFYQKLVQICPRCTVDMTLLLKNPIQTRHQLGSTTCDFHQVVIKHKIFGQIVPMELFEFYLRQR